MGLLNTLQYTSVVCICFVYALYTDNLYGFYIWRWLIYPNMIWLMVESLPSEKKCDRWDDEIPNIGNISKCSKPPTSLKLEMAKYSLKWLRFRSFVWIYPGHPGSSSWDVYESHFACESHRHIHPPPGEIIRTSIKTKKQFTSSSS